MAIGALEVEHLVEVAVVDLAAVADAEGIAAHKAAKGIGVEVVGEKFEVGVKFAASAEVFGEAGDGLICDREEAREFYGVVSGKGFAVIGFKIGLRGGKGCAEWIIDEVEGKFALATIAESIELAKGPDAFLVNAGATLAGDVLWEVAREGGDDLNMVIGEEAREIFEAGFFEYGEVVTVDNAGADGPGGLDEEAEVLAEFGRPAGDVHRGGAVKGDPVGDSLGSFRREHFRAPGTGINVAMAAGLIAFAADVNLEGLESVAAKGDVMGSEFLVEKVHSFSVARLR